MKYFIKIIILLSFAYSSSLSFNGFGSEYTGIDPAANGLGNSILFSGRPDGVVQSAMSTLHRSPLTKIHISNNFNQLSVLDATNSMHAISSIGFSFPFRKTHSISIGLAPKTRTDFNISQPQFEFISGGEESDPIAMKHSYNYSGGMSNLYVGLSSGYFDKIDLGFKWNILFGNLFADKITDTYSFNYNLDNCNPDSDGSYANDACISTNPNSTSISNNIYNFNGHSFTLDGRSEIDYHEIAVSISIDGPLTVVKSIVNNSLSGEDDLESIDEFFIGNFSCGYKFEPHQIGSGVIMELQQNLSAYSAFSNQLFQAKEPTSTSVHGGIYRQFESSRIGFWNTLTLRGGFMLKQINYDIYSVQDNAVTIGFGLKFLNNTNEIDISLSSGIRKTEGELYPDEKYINVNFGISSGDNWFKKIRRK